MDLGIAGRKAIVCASSKGLGRACAMALARAGCAVIVNGRDSAILEATAREIREATGAEVVSVAGDLDMAGSPRRLARRLSGARHSRQQQRRPAAGAVRRTDARAHPARHRVQHADADRAHSAGRAGHGAAAFRAHRQYHLGVGARADSRPRRFLGRARRLDRVHRGDRARARQGQCDHQFDPARRLRHRPASPRPAQARRGDGRRSRGGARRARSDDSRPPVRGAGGIRRAVRLSFAARRRATSSARIFSSTAAPFPARSETVRCFWELRSRSRRRSRSPRCPP